MRVRVEQTQLPGIGVRHDLVTSSGRTVGVVSHRNGRRLGDTRAHTRTSASIV